MSSIWAAGSVGPGAEAVDKDGFSVFGDSPPRGAGAIHLRRKTPERACLYKARLPGFVIKLRHSVPAGLLLAAMLLAFPAMGVSAGSVAGAEAVSVETDVVIETRDISATARFYPAVVEGVRMEILAVKAPDGTIRTAFNTCQVCFNSGRGYFVQKGNALECQNCGRRFRLDQVEKASGGCNPVPIFPRHKQVTEQTITIPYAFLQQAKAVFENWRR